MELKEIRRIIEMMKQNELTEFELQEEDFRIAIKRGNHDQQVVVSNSAASPMVASVPSSAPVAPAADTEASKREGKEKAVDEDAGLVNITSPIVGTFYRSSSPDADPFVKVGQEVDEETVVCIVEAMKVMNEIKAEVKGVIRKLLVENGVPVEFGQPLFKVEPV